MSFVYFSNCCIVCWFSTKFCNVYVILFPLVGAHDLMASGLENLSSHMGSLALTEMDWMAGNQGDASSVINHDESKHPSFPNSESDMNMKNNGGISMLAQRTPAVEDQLKRFGDFLAQPVSQPSFGPSCATTTSVHSSSVPMLNLTTYCSHVHQESGGNIATEPLSDFNANIQHEAKRSVMLTSGSSLKDISGEVKNGKGNDAMHAPSLATDTEKVIRQYDISKEQREKLARESDIRKQALQHNDKSYEGKATVGDATDNKSKAQEPKKSVSDVNLNPSVSEKPEKVGSGKSTSTIRKRNYDPDLFFKVNGKLYQRLGKIGSGGSSEVHKVISSDCTIYALKKIKLKGRDYATAYGFCQEIVYLNKLKGKNNIIQLVDYEVCTFVLMSFMHVFSFILHTSHFQFVNVDHFTSLSRCSGL